jgi:hypothetical protein
MILLTPKRWARRAFHFWWGCSVQLACYKTLWGFDGSHRQLAEAASSQGFDGIEAAIPEQASEVSQLAAQLSSLQLDYIAELATTGSYVPDRTLTVEDHLSDLRSQLERLGELKPRLINCLGGCDAWPIEQSLAFFRGAMALAAEYDQPISFETHRGRSLFNPWISQAIVQQLPDMKLTFDLSHWCVVCEGLQATEERIIQSLAEHCHHIHARVGYDQGPQVADPQLGVYQQDLARHLAWWRWVWQSQLQRGYTVTTATPEFGVDGYQYRAPSGLQTAVDLNSINLRMAATLRHTFQGVSAMAATAQADKVNAMESAGL